MTKKTPQSVGEILAQLFGRKEYRTKSAQYQLWECWGEIVGAQIAAQAQPLRMQGTTLIVGVTSSTWLQELTYLRPELLAKIQLRIDPTLIRELRFVFQPSAGAE